MVEVVVEVVVAVEAVAGAMALGYNNYFVL